MTRFTLAIIAALAAVAGAHAQYYRPPYPPSNPYAGNYYRSANPGRGYNQGAALAGNAQVMDAYGNVITSQEQARIMREQANQAKLDTKKKSFDLMNYEKANTPTYLEDLTNDQAALLIRIMDHPLKAEIAEGRTLNVMMPQMQKMSTAGVMGAPISLPADAVSALNIAGASGGSIGILKDGGKVDWVPAMRGPEQKKLDKLLPAAYNACLNDTLTSKQMKEIRTEMTSMRNSMRKQMQNDEIDTNAYMYALDIYENLVSSVKALERPGARKQLGGATRLTARNVPELVNFMTSKGLTFAPANPGFEGEYKVVHDAFVRYTRTAQHSSGGMQTMNVPTRIPEKFKLK